MLLNLAITNNKSIAIHSNIAPDCINLANQYKNKIKNNHNLYFFITWGKFQGIYTDDWIIDVNADNLSIGEGHLRNFQTFRTGQTDLLQEVEKESQLHIIIIRRNNIYISLSHDIEK